MPDPVRLPSPARARVLHPGDVALGLRGDRLETLLGSCVAIILTDPRRTVAAMCHIVHARPRTAGAPPAGPGAHADDAWAEMHRLLLVKGIQPHLCDAFVYGGGNMFPHLVRDHHVGEQNAVRALQMLASAGNRVLDEDLGGTAYRRVSWVVGEGPPSVVCASAAVAA